MHGEKLFINETSELNRNLFSFSSWCESILTALLPSGEEQTAYEYWHFSSLKNGQFVLNYFSLSSMYGCGFIKQTLKIDGEHCCHICYDSSSSVIIGQMVLLN